MLVNEQSSSYNIPTVKQADGHLRIDIEAIISKYKPIVSFRVKKSLGAQTPDWEDVVNEIMVNVIEKLESGNFRGDSTIGTFIYTITSRRIIDFIRKKSKVLKYAPEVSSPPLPCENIENKERAEHLAQCLKKLKPKYKEVLYLYYYKEFSREEAAQELGITPQKVSERVNYAQKLLKKMLAE